MLPPAAARRRSPPDAAPLPAGLYMGGQEALQQVEDLRITHVLVRRRRCSQRRSLPRRALRFGMCGESSRSH